MSTIELVALRDELHELRRASQSRFSELEKRLGRTEILVLELQADCRKDQLAILEKLSAILDAVTTARPGGDVPWK